MIGVPGREGNRDVQVIIGVDTHQDEHVAVAIDRQGVRLGERHAPATTHGYGELEWWSLSLGEVRAFGIEGTGSYGAGIARFLTGRGGVIAQQHPGRHYQQTHRHRARCRTSRNPRPSPRWCPHRSVQASVSVVWTIPRRRPSTLSAHWPAATANLPPLKFM